MAFEDTTLWVEVKDIINADTERRLYDFRGTVHTEKEDFPVWELSSVELVRDYMKMIGETSKIIFRIGLGDYTNRFYPYRENLEFTVKRIPLKEGKNGPTNDDEVVVTRYKAIFNPANNPQVGGSELETYHTESLNNTEMVEVHLELVNRYVEPLRIKTTSGSFLEYKPEDIIRAVLGGESQKVLVDGKPCIEGFDLVEPDNKEIQPHVILPHGIHVTAVPTYLQENLCGVYNRGLGTFFQVFEKKKFWFVYPTFDYERFDEDVKKVIFYAVPQDKLPQLDKSYKEDGDILKVAVTAQRRYTDTAELNYVNEGSGFRMPDARSFMKKPVKITEDGPVADRIHLNHEVVTKERTDNLNYAPMVKHGPSQNPFKYRTEINRLTMGQIDLVWENADPELIYPGMPCKYLYLNQNKVVSLKGTILFVHAFSARVERYNASAFRTTCRLSIACEPQTKKPDLPDKRAVGD